MDEREHLYEFSHHVGQRPFADVVGNPVVAVSDRDFQFAKALVGSVIDYDVAVAPQRLDNDWQFVEDDDSELVDSRIPALKFTAYFAARTVPKAPITNQAMRMHDEFHVPQYQQMFSSVALSDTVFAAANQAVGDEEKSSSFTRAIDKLGDSLFIVSFGRLGMLDSFDTIKGHVTSLVELANQKDNDKEPVDQEVLDEKVTQILEDLGVSPDLGDAHYRSYGDIIGSKTLLSERIEVGSSRNKELYRHFLTYPKETRKKTLEKQLHENNNTTPDSGQNTVQDQKAWDVPSAGHEITATFDGQCIDGREPRLGRHETSVFSGFSKGGMLDQYVDKIHVSTQIATTRINQHPHYRVTHSNTLHELLVGDKEDAVEEETHLFPAVFSGTGHLLRYTFERPSIPDQQ